MRKFSRFWVITFIAFGVLTHTAHAQQSGEVLKLIEVLQGANEDAKTLGILSNEATQNKLSKMLELFGLSENEMSELRKNPEKMRARLCDELRRGTTPEIMNQVHSTVLEDPNLSKLAEYTRSNQIANKSVGPYFPDKTIRFEGKPEIKISTHDLATKALDPIQQMIEKNSNLGSDFVLGLKHLMLNHPEVFASEVGLGLEPDCLELSSLAQERLLKLFEVDAEAKLSGESVKDAIDRKLATEKREPLDQADQDRCGLVNSCKYLKGLAAEGCS